MFIDSQAKACLWSAREQIRLGQQARHRYLIAYMMSLGSLSAWVSSSAVKELPMVTSTRVGLKSTILTLLPNFGYVEAYQ